MLGRVHDRHLEPYAQRLPACSSISSSAPSRSLGPNQNGRWQNEFVETTDQVRRAKAVRLGIILALGLVLFALPVALLNVGEHRLDEDEPRVLRQASSVRIDGTTWLAWSAGQNPAKTLDLLGERVSAAMRNEGVSCVRVTMRRLVASRTLYFATPPGGGTLHRVGGC